MWRLILVLSVSLLLGGCLASRMEVPATARSLIYDAGGPIFDAEAYPIDEDGSPKLRVTWGVIPASLVTTSISGAARAIVRSRVELRVKDEETVLETFGRSDSLVFRHPDEVRSFRHIVKNYDLSAAPGAYEVDVIVEDLTSGASTRHRLDVARPAPAGEAAAYVRLVAHEGGDTFPVLSYHVPAEVDSVTAHVAFWNVSDHASVSVLRVESDTSVAEPPWGLNPTRAALVQRGLRMELTENLTSRRLTGVGDGTEQGIRFSERRPGYYRVVVESDEQVVTRRDFFIRERGFPDMQHLDVMANALAYLATRREHRSILAAEDPVELKRRFDAFWGSLVSERRHAARLVELYYSRAEEANRRFSGVKDGWKTDRGMVFMVRGAPLFVERIVDREIWHYSYSEVNPAHIFVFERIPVDGYESPLQHFVLQRSPVFEYEWRRWVDRWRSGDVL